MLIEGSECRGVDTRFAVDASVLIIADVRTFHSLQQMSGRSSRSRNVCESTYYTVTKESRNQIIDRLKRCSISELSELEKALKLFEIRSKDPSLLQVLRVQHNAGKSVRTIKQLENVMDEKNFAKIIKGVQL